MWIRTGLIFLWMAQLACAAPELVGEWKSNKALTLKTVTLPEYVTPDLKARFEALFGLMELRYTKQACLSYFPAIGDAAEERHRMPYKILSETEDQLVLEGRDWQTNEPSVFVINFVSPDRYWVALPNPDGLKYFEGAREYFDRVKPASPAE